MAPWDQTNGWWNYDHTQQLSGDKLWVQQWPYTMSHYVSGSGMASGETVYIEGHPGGPWYDEDGWHGDPPSYEGPDRALQMHCPTISKAGHERNPDWYDWTSFSYGVIGAHKDPAGQWVYTEQDYPTPDIMPHAATTMLLTDICRPAEGVNPAAWIEFDRVPGDPHMGKSNYMFVDGHVEMLDAGSITADMWESMR